MSRLAAPQLNLVKREEKEPKLTGLILDYLEQMGTHGSGIHGASSCLFIARSAESPVAKTILSLGAHAALKGFSVRAIFAFLGTAETVRIAEACRASDWALQVRWARDLRLLEAHEQLVLGHGTSWMGDSMRRDPLSRDATELYAPDCPLTTQRAKLFFDRLWQISEPVFERQVFDMPSDSQPELVPPFQQPGLQNGGKLRPRTSA